MNVWLARSPSGTRFRIDVESYPHVMASGRWEIRAGEIGAETYQRICTSADAVEIEQLHQDLWRRLLPAEEA